MNQVEMIYVGDGDGDGCHGRFTASEDSVFWWMCRCGRDFIGMGPVECAIAKAEARAHRLICQEAQP